MLSSARPDRLLAPILAACGTFLLAVMWMDLMFDMLVMTDGSDAAVAAVADYYRQVTSNAGPMPGLIAVTMLIAVIGAVKQARRSRGPRWRRFGLVALVAVPVALAGSVVFPAAVELGSGAASPRDELALARRILAAHVACFASVLVFSICQLRIAARDSSSADSP